jgi:hypothetical protein
MAGVRLLRASCRRQEKNVSESSRKKGERKTVKITSPSSIALAQEALATLSQDTRISVLDTESKDATVFKVSIAYESARKLVLGDHTWNFARAEKLTNSTHVKHDNVYPWSTPMPGDSLRIIAVYDMTGMKADYIVYENTLRSSRPIERIVYTRDEDDIDNWSADARRAFVYRLAADIAKPITGRINEAQLQEEHYRMAIEKAKLRQAREGEAANPWGENHHARAMRGELLR